jgi:hypothetical protein
MLTNAFDFCRMTATGTRYSFALALAAALVLGRAPGFAQHRLLVGDQLNGKILIIEKDERVSWEYPEAGMVMDGEVLPGGNVLFCFFRTGAGKAAGVKEVTPDKRTIFEYAVEQECHSVQRLPDGLTLIEDPVHRRLIEVDRNGKIAKEITLQIGHDKVHRVARQCRKLENGHYLVAQEGDQQVVEYDPDGKVLRRIPVKGFVYGVAPLPNGNLLIGTGGGPDAGRSAVEITPEGRVAWAFAPADFPRDTNLDWVLGVQRLANGNTIIPNYLGHGKGGKGIWLLEVSPEKKIVWTRRDPRIVLLAKVLDGND